MNALRQAVPPRGFLLAGVAFALALSATIAAADRLPFVVDPAAGDTGLPPGAWSRLTGQGLDRFADGVAPYAARELAAAATGNAWAAVPPPARWVHSMVYDPIRDRLVVFGGQSYAGSSNEVWAFYLSGIPHWTRLAPSGTPPSPRAFQSAVYDSLADRIVIFGGDDGVARNDVWQLTFGGNPTWSQLAVAGTPPPPRRWHSAIVDRARNRMIVYGGENGATRYADAWALALGGAPAWTQLLPTGAAPARSAHAAAYDAAADRMVIFGGLDAAGQPTAAVHALSFAGTPAWSTLAPAGAGPTPRYGTSALYDRVRRRLVLFAGGTGAPNSNELWLLSLDGAPAWTALAPAGSAPQGRQFHAVAYDPLGDRMLVFGGSSGPILSDTWALSLTPSEKWTPLSGTRRRGHSAVLDTARDRMIVFGGENATQLDDVWQMSLAGDPNWERLNPDGTPPSPRALHGAIYDARRDRMLVFGGRGGPPTNDVWELTFSGTLAWRPIVPTGTPPAPRLDHLVVLDPERYRLLVFGGADTGGVYNDVWALSLSGVPAWTQLAPAGGAPAARGAAQGIYDAARDRLVIFGGYNRNFIAQSDAWALALSGTPTWTQLAPSGTPPSARFGGATIYDPVRDRMVMSSGSDFSTYFPDLWALALGGGTPAWNALVYPGTGPTSRSDHRAVYDPARDRMVLFGGINPLGILHDAWSLDFTATVGVPDGAIVRTRGPALEPAVPNPTRGATRLGLALPRPAWVEAGIFDLAGRRVRRLAAGEMAAGHHVLAWDGADEAGGRAPAGLYFLRVVADGEKAAGKIVLAR